MLVALLIYTYLGYPVAIGLLARLRRRRVVAANGPLPSVSVFLPVYNGAAYLRPRSTACWRRTIRGRSDLLVSATGAATIPRRSRARWPPNRPPPGGSGLRQRAKVGQADRAQHAGPRRARRVAAAQRRAPAPVAERDPRPATACQTRRSVRDRHLVLIGNAAAACTGATRTDPPAGVGVPGRGGHDGPHRDDPPC